MLSPCLGVEGFPKGSGGAGSFPKASHRSQTPPWGDKTRSGTSKGDEPPPKSMVLGEAGLMAQLLVQILREHVMVRVGGGWDTLQHYLDKHDPCRCTSLCECPCRWEGRKGGGSSLLMGVSRSRRPPNPNVSLGNRCFGVWLLLGGR